MEPILFNMDLNPETKTLTIGFGDPSTNDQIVAQVERRLKAVPFPGGDLIKINGPASLPVAFVLAHHLIHLYGAVAIKDPKLGGFVVAVSHNPSYPVGHIIPA